MNTFYIETYGCRMNICDSEVIIRILTDNGYIYSNDINSADFIILNSCSVREDGHSKIYERLDYIGNNNILNIKNIIVAGCFASLLSESFFEKYDFVDLIANNLTYKILPLLFKKMESGARHLIARTDDDKELYQDIIPDRALENKTSAAVCIMKGCNQKCAYCIEPFTRGKESCRSAESILYEIDDASVKGYKEITLVGHSIDKYKSFINSQRNEVCFAQLLDLAAKSFPNIRIKFLSSHPLFLSDDILMSIARNNNIMRVIHFPIQSGSNKILKAMNRDYTQEYILERLKRIMDIVPDMRVVTDVIVGFCGETEEDYEQTRDFIKDKFIFNDINVFKYSMRPNTYAHRMLTDDVPEDIKEQRYKEIVEIRDILKYRIHKNMIGTTVRIIVENIQESIEMTDNYNLANKIYVISGRDRYNTNVRYEVKANSTCGSLYNLINTEQDVKIYRADANGLIGNEY